MVNMMDIHIIDINGEEYDINSIHIDGNDVLSIVVKKSGEDYVSRRVGREIVDEHIGWKPL